MTTLMLIKTGSTYQSIQSRHGDFERWFERHLSGTGHDLRVVDVARGQALPPVNEVAGAVVTGSPAMVTDREDWSERTKDWLATAAAQEVPLFGVCYGHHLLAAALGGRVGFHPEGREIGTHEVRRLAEAVEDPLFSRLPERFQGHLSHKQSVLALPPGAVHLARGDFEPHQAFRWGSCCWGVQFHPEFDEAVMNAYLDALEEEIQGEGLNPQWLRRQVVATPEATSLLRAFTEWALARG